MSRTSYSEKLRDPRWQKKRLEIMQRDGFACSCCVSKIKTLHVHHLTYKRGKEPWDYPDHNFETLCEECHQWREWFNKEICEGRSTVSTGLCRMFYFGFIPVLAGEVAMPKQTIHSFILSGLSNYFRNHDVKLALRVDKRNRDNPKPENPTSPP